MAILGIATCVTFAGSPRDPAFFVHGTWQYQGLLFSPRGEVKSWSGQTLAGVKSPEGHFILGLEGASPELHTKNSDLQSQDAMAFASWNYKSAQLLWGTRGQDNPFYGLGYHWQSSAFQAQAQTKWGSSQPYRIAVTDTALPPESPRIVSHYQTKQHSAQIKLTYLTPQKHISGRVLFQRTTPLSADTGHVLRDSSLWLSGSLNASWKLAGVFWQPQINSTSGRWNFLGSRKEQDVDRTVLKMRTGWDLNSASLLLAPEREAAPDDPAMHELGLPWERISILRLQPTPTMYSLRLYGAALNGTIHKPDHDQNDETIWGNRLFAPDLKGLLGMSFYRKNFGVWGDGTIQTMGTEATIPYSVRAIHSWLAIGVQYWQGSARTHLRTRVSQALFETEETQTDDWHFESGLFLIGLGLQGELPVLHTLTWDIRIQQLAPFATIIEQNDAPYFHTSKGHTIKPSFQPFRDGFQASLDLFYQL